MIRSSIPSGTLLPLNQADMPTSSGDCPTALWSHSIIFLPAIGHSHTALMILNSHATASYGHTEKTHLFWLFPNQLLKYITIPAKNAVRTKRRQTLTKQHYTLSGQLEKVMFTESISCDYITFFFSKTPNLTPGQFDLSPKLFGNPLRGFSLHDILFPAVSSLSPNARYHCCTGRSFCRRRSSPPWRY